MFGLLTVTLLTSLVLGMRHAIDPDHVVAVTTIVSRERSVWRAAAVGAQWGLGHSLTVIAVGGAIILFKLSISPRVGLSMEFAVALMLIALGVINMAGARPSASPTLRAATLPPLAVGLVHGMAGSAAAALLVIGLIPDPRWAVAALAVFCLGTLLGMALVTAAIAAPAAYAGARVDRLQRRLRFAAGALSAGFGVYLAHQIGFVDGLFTAHPQWEAK